MLFGGDEIMLGKMIFFFLTRVRKLEAKYFMKRMNVSGVGGKVSSSTHDSVSRTHIY